MQTIQYTDKILPSNSECAFNIRNREQCIARRLEKLNLHRIRVNRDGNCFFNAVVQAMQDTNLVGKELNPEDLRQMCAYEWEKYSFMYKSFVPKLKDTSEELDNFRSDYCFDADLGDVLPITIANLFKLKLVIITSIPNIPNDIEVIPMNFNAKEAKQLPKIYLVYDHGKPEHYDYAREFGIGPTRLTLSAINRSA
ncbi:hypothetical protein GJ496_009272 [Pomphorhynchus laevis]|nr:hypothetical protein GJ496_009272 [Pomphorhynchus laevis]